MSPARTKPAQAPRKSSTRTTYAAPVSVRKWPDQVSDITVRTPTSSTRRSAGRSATRATPTGCPWVGSHPPSQTTRAVSPPRTTNHPARAASTTATAKAAGSATRRPIVVTDPPAIRAAPSNGTTTSMTAPVLTGRSLLELFLERPDLLRVDAALTLGELDGQRQQQGGDRPTHDDVGEGERLHHRVDHGHSRLDVGEDRGRPVRLPADQQEQQVRRRLHHRQARDHMDEAPARGD